MDHSDAKISSILKSMITPQWFFKKNSFLWLKNGKKKEPESKSPKSSSFCIDSPKGASQNYSYFNASMPWKESEFTLTISDLMSPGFFGSDEKWDVSEPGSNQLLFGLHFYSSVMCLNTLVPRFTVSS